MTRTIEVNLILQSLHLLNDTGPAIYVGTVDQ